MTTTLLVVDATNLVVKIGPDDDDTRRVDEDFVDGTTTDPSSFDFTKLTNGYFPFEIIRNWKILEKKNSFQQIKSEQLCRFEYLTLLQTVPVKSSWSMT